MSRADISDSIGIFNGEDENKSINFITAMERFEPESDYCI